MYIETILKLGFICVIVGAFALSHFIGLRDEKKCFNKGICPYCNIKLVNFDTDSQGGRGYTCKKCDYTTWVSYSSVDKDFEDKYKICKKKHVYSSKIEELIYDEDSVVVFDIDGVLAKYEFGEHNHNSCSDEEWDANVTTESVLVYGAAKPVELFQRLIRNKKHVYACSMYSPGEEDAKMSFVRRYYNIPAENIYLVRDKTHKLAVMDKIAERHPFVPAEKIIMVEDTVKTLTYIQDNSEYSTCHVSSFLE